ncbi:MAG: ATP synthase F1 subunit gamma [Bacteroidales bacterium]|nr:ATP synthase F1 subunit gamma [Bacteroidales bacterium]
MTSLKEIKGRITSIRNIWKITSAMRMIAAAKLHRAQGAVANVFLYEQRLHEMLSALLSLEGALDSPYTRSPKEVKRVAIVAFSSNSSLCGAFNMNILRKLNATIKENFSDLHTENILIFPVGRRIHDAALREGYAPQGDFHLMAEKPNYTDAASLSRRLIELFCTHQVDRVVLVHNHYKSMSVQVPTVETYLPFTFPKCDRTKNVGNWKITPDFILEPSFEQLISLLLPKVLELKIFTTLLDSSTAEHAARTIAMQTATENAEKLLSDLTLIYNKSRQQAITNELLDMVGGAAR